jgi:nucleolar protein 56
MKPDKMREQALKQARKDVKQKKSSEDLLVVQAVEAIDELDDVINIIHERVTNWYDVHYPELKEIVKNPDTYLTIVRDLKTREETFEQELNEIMSEEQAQKIALEAEKTMGADLEDKDLERVRRLAGLCLDLKKERRELSDYVEERVQEIAPNLHSLVGGMLAARLISHAGSLEKLAEMPSSTIQVLGAEKALFAHLRKGTPPPKHGIIYHSPFIIQSPRKKRGKIARALASKLAIAAREDFFEGKEMGKQLRQELEERVSQIKS